jgi:hypothetical protein
VKAERHIPLRIPYLWGRSKWKECRKHLRLCCPYSPTVFKALVQGCKHVFLLLSHVALFRRPEPTALSSPMFRRLFMLLLFLLLNNNFVLCPTPGSAKASPLKIIITVHRAKHGFFSGNSILRASFVLSRL